MGTKILIGSAGAQKVSLDLDVLLRTRLLIQANSGGGKSWLLRRLAEQLFGKIPVILIDPEGEFASLREHYGYVLVGKGGETPADTRSAALVAHKLLELRASAVCDIYELKPQTRHLWVKLFLEALVDAPKSLWRPTVVIVDESHVYAPEKGQGESEAYGAMSDLVTRGRKRGFCPIFATQRLAKLSKNISAEMLNRLVGQTFEDVDLDRAADLLSIPRSDRMEFFRGMKVIEPGYFWALGRAIAKDRVLTKVGSVSTTHPEPGTAGYTAEPPPAPEKVRALLPKLADLPKEAERRAQTEAELRQDIRSLKAQLAARPTEIVEKPKEKRVEVPVVKDRDIKRVETVVARIGKLVDSLSLSGVAIGAEGSRLSTAIAMASNPNNKGTGRISQPFMSDRARRPGGDDAMGRATQPSVKPGEAIRAAQVETSEESLTGPEQRILDAIAWLESIGVVEPEQTAVAFLAGYTFGGGAFNNPKGKLNGKGLVRYLGDRIQLTDAGRQGAHTPQAPLTTEELHERVMARLEMPHQRILKPLLNVYPKSLSNEELAEKAGYTVGAGAFNNPRGRLRSLGLIEYSEPGRCKAKSLLFLD